LLGPRLLLRLLSLVLELLLLLCWLKLGVFLRLVFTLRLIEDLLF
jgi:hypothetical protein